MFVSTVLVSSLFESPFGRRSLAATAAITIGLATVPGKTSAHPGTSHLGETNLQTENEPAAFNENGANDKDGTNDKDSVSDKSDAANSASRLPGNADCKEMTDSIVRLYQGYLERIPTDKELDADIEAYRTGTESLKSLSEALHDSGEFTTATSKLTDKQYIDLVFSQTVQREPSETELSHWTASLSDGAERSTMMLSFTESQEFVTLTDTSVPLAGYDRWYPEGAYWYCGRGSQRFDIQPLSGEVISSDFIFINHGLLPSFTELWVLDANFNQNVQMTSSTIPPKFSDYNWDGAFTGDGDYGDRLDVQTGDGTRWIIVFYPTSIGENRPGWELVVDG